MAALLSSALPLGSEVGLQLLLAPASSSIIVRGACAVVGVGVPLFSTFKAMESENQDEMRDWLAYWSVYGCLTAAESAASQLVQWLPFYHHVKLGLLIWLQLPLYDGAKRIFRCYLRPLFRRHQQSLDRAISAGRRQLTIFLQAHSREINAAASFVHRVFSSVLRVMSDIVRGIHFPPGDADDSAASPTRALGQAAEGQEAAAAAAAAAAGAPGTDQFSLPGSLPGALGQGISGFLAAPVADGRSDVGVEEAAREQQRRRQGGSGGAGEGPVTSEVVRRGDAARRGEGENGLDQSGWFHVGR